MDGKVDLVAISSAGYAALRAGDTDRARRIFSQATTIGAADAAMWFGLSMAHRARAEPAEEQAALDRVLQLDDRHLPALIAKGDLYARAGDRRAASAFYNAVVKLVPTMSPLSAEWQSEVRRIESLSRKFAADFSTHVQSALDAAGVGAPGGERFGRAVDLLLGKREIYHQQPKHFFFPELPETQFFDRHLFPWVTALESEFAAIRMEARAVLDSGAGIVPYVQARAGRPPHDVVGLLDNPRWGAFFLVKDGVKVAKNAERCPRTVAAMQNVSLCRIDNRTPSVLFSVLQPGTRIPPHHGYTNARLICHLPLIVPPQCGLRVGNETRSWREGEVVVFDDSIEHEAWNGSAEQRAVLIFDIWRPELSQQEQDLVAAMMAAIDRFDGSRGRWTD